MKKLILIALLCLVVTFTKAYTISVPVTQADINNSVPGNVYTNSLATALTRIYGPDSGTFASFDVQANFGYAFITGIKYSVDLTSNFNLLMEMTLNNKSFTTPYTATLTY